MKKKLFVLVVTSLITVSSAIPTFASSRKSPTNVTITPTPTSRITVTPTPPGRSPKTGSVDYVLYGGLGAATFASVAVFSKKKKDTADI